MKRILILFLVLVAVTFTAVATGEQDDSAGSADYVTAPGTFPIVTEPITLDFFATPSENYILEDNDWFAWIEDATGIAVNFETVATGDAATEKINLLLVSQTDLPDVFMTYGSLSGEQLAIYGGQGLFVNLRDYWDLLPNMQNIEAVNPTAVSSVSAPDGGLYSFLTQNICTHCLRSQRMFVNQTWLDNLGLERPTTVDEFYDMLVAFAENDANGNGDPSDEIPLSALSAGWRVELYGYLMQPFAKVGMPTDFLYMEDGTIVSALYDPGFKDGMKFLARLYSEGLLDAEAFTMNAAQMRALTETAEGNRVGAVQSGSLGPLVSLGTDGARNDFVGLEPLEGPGGRRTVFFQPFPENRFAVTSTGDHVEAALRLGDFFMADPFSGNEDDLVRFLNNQEGPNGWRSAAGETALFGGPAFFERQFAWGEPTTLNIGNLPPRYSTVDAKTVQYAEGAFSGFSHERFLVEVAERYAPYDMNITIPPVVVSTENAAQYADARTLSLDFIRQELAAFVIGAKDVDSEWDRFIDELQSFGYDDYISIYQAAYDSRYK